MVKLVAVRREDEEYEYESRQLPVNVDKHLTLVVQLDDPLQSGYRNSNAKCDLRTFIKNYNILNVEEVRQACMMNGRDLSTFLSHMVPCVGCRRSVEQMFNLLADQEHPALDPVLVTSHRTMYIKKSVSSNPTALYKLFYHDVFHMYSLIENILKNKKNKRCYIHSLDMQKPKLGRVLPLQTNSSQTSTNTNALPPAQSMNIPYYGNGSWMDIWNDLSNECKEEIVILDCEGILDLMEDYLKRHRFCKDCKSKVARAFGILVDEIDPEKESDYCSALYGGLRFCGPKSKIEYEPCDEEDEEELENAEMEEDEDSQEEHCGNDCDHDHDHDHDHDGHDHSSDVSCDNVQKKETADKSTETGGDIDTSNQSRHIHVCCETNYIAHLMTRAEGEISGGSRRERHAKTIDVAQEEVLTCISLYLYKRLHKLWRKVKAESQTWRLLFYVSVETMRRVFEIVVEEKVGMGKLEALCEELEEEERKLEQKQEKKRQKKKRQKKRKEEAKKLEGAEVISCNGTSEKSASQAKAAKPEPKPKVTPCSKFKTNIAVPPPILNDKKIGATNHSCRKTHKESKSENDCAEKENKAANGHRCHKDTADHSGHSNCRSCEKPASPPKTTIPAEGSCDECQFSQDNGKNKKGKKKNQTHCGGGGGKTDRCNFHFRLLEMLGEESDGLACHGEKVKDGKMNGELAGSCDKAVEEGSDNEGLTAEEIADFELNSTRIRQERKVLREKIRKNFEQLCVKNEEKLSIDTSMANGDVGYHSNGKKSKESL